MQAARPAVPTDAPEAVVEPERSATQARAGDDVLRKLWEELETGVGRATEKWDRSLVDPPRALTTTWRESRRLAGSIDALRLARRTDQEWAELSEHVSARTASALADLSAEERAAEAAGRLRGGEIDVDDWRRLLASQA